MHRPSVWTRLRIRAAGEIPTDELQAYRTASLEVWSLVESVAERRRTGAVTPVENLGGWIVFGLQTFGNALMDADAHANPVTAGYVPRVTHGAILNLYREVGPWLLRARSPFASGPEAPPQDPRCAPANPSRPPLEHRRDQRPARHRSRFSGRASPRLAFPVG